MCGPENEKVAQKMNWLNQWWWQAIHPHQLAIKYTLRWYLFGTYRKLLLIGATANSLKTLVGDIGFEPMTR
jgi:hypothetical protein